MSSYAISWPAGVIAYGPTARKLDSLPCAACFSMTLGSDAHINERTYETPLYAVSKNILHYSELTQVLACKVSFKTSQPITR